jgi:hypothetical protein
MNFYYVDHEIIVNYYNAMDHALSCRDYFFFKSIEETAKIWKEIQLLAVYGR